MTKLPHISGNECIKALEKAGFVVQRQTGRHIVMENNSQRVLVPTGSRSLEAEILRRIIRTAGLLVEEFVELL